MTTTLTPTVTKTYWPAVWAMAFATYAVAAAEMMPMALLSPMARDTGVTDGTLGQALTAVNVGATLTALFFSAVVRGLNRRILLLVAVGLSLVSSVVVAVATSVVALAIAWTMVGMMIGLYWSQVASLSMRLVPAGDVPRALTLVYAGGAIAGLTAPPLGSLLAGTLGWRAVFWGIAGVATLAIAALMVTVPSLPTVSRVRLGDTFGLLRHRAIVLGLIGILLSFGGQRFLMAYARPLLERATHGQVGWISLALLLIGLAVFVGNSFAGRCISRDLIGTATAAVAVNACLAALMIVVGRGMVGAIVVMMLWSAAFAMVPVAWSTWVTRAAPEKAESAGGLYVASVQAAFMIATAAGGGVLDRWGLDVMLAVAAAVLALAAVHLRLVVRSA